MPERNSVPYSLESSVITLALFTLALFALAWPYVVVAYPALCFTISAIREMVYQHGITAYL